MVTNYGEDPATDAELVQYVRLRKNGGYFGPGIGRVETAYYRLNEVDLVRIGAEYNRRYERDSSGENSSGRRLCWGASLNGGGSPRGSGSPRGR